MIHDVSAMPGVADRPMPALPDFPLYFGVAPVNDGDSAGDRSGPRTFRVDGLLRPAIRFTMPTAMPSVTILAAPGPSLVVTTPMAISMAVTVAVAMILMAATIALRSAESGRRRRLLERLLRRLDREQVDDRSVGHGVGHGVGSGDESATTGRDRGRPATLRRRRGGEWDTPVVPTVSTSPHRRDRRRSRRV